MMIKVVLDNVRSAHNVGAVFRTADSLGVGEVILCGITAVPPSREIHKSALGAEMTVPFRYFDSSVEAVETLKSEGCTIVAVEQAEGSVRLQDFEPVADTDYAFVLGNEVEGVSVEVLERVDSVVEIAQRGMKKSMNVSVAGGIVLWEVLRKL